MSFSYSDKKKYSKNRDESKSKYNWPKQGISIGELMNISGIKVYVSSTFINTPAFYAFVRMWQIAKTSGTVQQNYYIHMNDLVNISNDYRFLLSADDYQECISWAAPFGKASESMDGNIVLLTADAVEGQKAQRQARGEGCYLRWYGMDREGKLCLLYLPKADETQKNRQSSHISGKRNNLQEDRKPAFRVTQEIAQIGKAARPIASVPATGNRVKCGRADEITLGRPIMTDHISITYETDKSGYYAKIYTKEALAIDLLENKAKRMLQERIKIPGVCWPEDVLEDQSGCFVGILVPESRGIQLSQSIFAGSSGLEQYFPQWDKQDLCMAASTILDIICKLHKEGILFGCLNPASIYIKDKNEVYFVDADNWQIEGYPSLSRNQTFTPPELIDKESDALLFNMDQDNYQVAVLAFMLMMPGKFPYAKGKRGNERDSISHKSFPFSVGVDMRRTRDSEKPTGVWRIVWDHLPYRMCEEFYDTFHESGKFSSVGNRPKETVWAKLVKDFGMTLSTSDRLDSRSMFPSTFRRDGKRVFEKCSICGQEHPDFYFMHNVMVKGEKIDVWQRGYRVCLPCANGQSDMYFDCRCCGKRFYYTNRTKILHLIGKSEFDFKDQKWCSACKKRKVRCTRCGREVLLYQMSVFEDRMRNLRMSVCSDCKRELIEDVKKQAQQRNAWKEMVYSYGRCRICGSRFAITNGEKEYCEKKGFALPTHCPTHRKKN